MAAPLFRLTEQPQEQTHSQTLIWFLLCALRVSVLKP